MKTIAVFAALVAIALAAPQHNDKEKEGVRVVKEKLSNNIGLDNYEFSYELSDGQTREETAEVETRGEEESILRVRGSFSWVNPENGQTYKVTYVADENGFQPQGDHILVAPIA